MADERALVFLIKTNLDKLQSSLQRCQGAAQRFSPEEAKINNWFVSGIVESRTAVRELLNNLDLLSRIRNDDPTRAAIVHAQGLQTDIERFFKDPAILKLSTALSHLDAIIEFTQKRLDPAYQRTGATTAQATSQTLSLGERKERFLQLWRAENGTMRLKSILQDFTTIKSLLASNTILQKTNKLTTATQAKTQFQETQATIEKRLSAQLNDIYSKIFQPCIPEGELFAFETPSPFKTNLIRKCDVRKVFNNGKALEDPIVLIASDLRCIQAFDILDMHSGWLREKIGAKFTIISLVSRIIHLKDAVLALSDLIPSSDSSQLKGLFWTWYQTDKNEFNQLSEEVGNAYPHYYQRMTPAEFGKGL